MTVNTDFNLGTDSDALYNELLDAHVGLSAEKSTQLNAALILVMMNHIGDADIIRDAVRTARASIDN
ncbi:MAG: DUF2783 domain-containing protein [Candidatus Puniceispirillum sp.]|jgi:hypothetical protein|uniref:DUF2783 domain-containing protein n=1 Tax=Candidatus Puniceispirillum sp. TaxID=2026719 RepID=UPI001EB0E283|nr:DUF2783 domain-containing protein [Candidatus Puniceispirillum sp.]MBT6416169.1 DUF2783 domain-containing protein [Candidatus Puniceispirillum sp.]MBT6565897.1 DUF2783 domain-containing protein [Candidatus Puniceispirillum sp.]